MAMTMIVVSITYQVDVQPDNRSHVATWNGYDFHRVVFFGSRTCPHENKTALAAVARRLRTPLMRRERSYSTFPRFFPADRPDVIGRRTPNESHETACSSTGRARFALLASNVFANATSYYIQCLLRNPVDQERTKAGNHAGRHKGLLLNMCNKA
jgi:hypothetical protein